MLLKSSRRYGPLSVFCKVFLGIGLSIGLGIGYIPLGAPAALSAQASQTAGNPITIIALGDSLSAGYLLPPGAGFPEQLQSRLEADGLAVTIVNAGVSGDTSTGGLARLDWTVGPEADAVILELGANDALRGIDPDLTRRNLDTIITTLKARGIEVLLAGMLAPPNMGKEYGAEFNRIFSDLAATHKLVFYPFFLNDVAADPNLNLTDGIHPTSEGVGVIVEGITPYVYQLITRVEAHRH